MAPRGDEAGVRRRAVVKARAALASCTPGDPERPALEAGLGRELCRLYDCTEDRALLEEAVQLHRSALQATSQHHPDYPARSAGLAAAMTRWYRLTGQRDALAQAIASRRLALEGTPPEDPSLPARLHDLGSVLEEGYRRSGDLPQLEEAILRKREAVARTPRTDPKLPRRLRSLAKALRTLYERTGDAFAVDEAIGRSRASLQLARNAPTERRKSLTGLGNGLHMRFMLTGRFADLEEAVECRREALRLAPPELPDLDVYLMNLGAALHARFQRTGERAALEESIECNRAALRHKTKTDAGRHRTLSNLGNTLQAWYVLTREKPALEEAIACKRKAVDLSPEGSPDRAACLNNLGTALQEWYRRTGEREALEEAIAHKRAAVELTPPGRPDRPGRLNNLAGGLLALYRASGDPEVLETVIDMRQEAVDLTPRGHPSGPLRRSGLAAALEERYDATVDPAALDAAITWRRAAALGAQEFASAGELPPPVLRRLQSSLARVLMRRDGERDWAEANEAISRALELQESELGRQSGERAILDYLRRKESTYRRAVRCRLGLAQRSQEQGDAVRAQLLREQAWEAAEQGKGRLFAAILAAQRTLPAATPETSEIVRRIEEIRDELARIEREFDAPDGVTSRTVAQLGTARWREVYAEYRHALAQMEARDPELAGLIAAKPRSLADVQAAIPSGATLVELYPLEDSIAIFALDGRDLRCASSPLEGSTLLRWTRELDAATQRPTPSRDAEEALSELMSRMAAVLEPVLSQLLGAHDPKGASEEARHLLVVPTGPLHRWPLHLLPWRDGILWEAFAVSYLPTADTLAYCTERVPAGVSPPLLLAPDPSLPGSFAEAALAVPLGWETALREQATPHRLSGSFRGLTLATHVVPDRDEGLASRLRMWTGEGPGWVSALELLQAMRGHASAEHAQVGGCAAHVESVRPGDHLQGLTRTFLAAGLRSLTTTLWPIDDLAACWLGARLRRLYADDPARSKASCMRQAALELRDGGWAAAGNWLVQQPRERAGEELVLEVAAVLCLRGGDLDAFVRLWDEAASGKPPAEAGVYSEARRALADYGALRRLSASLSPQHWAQWRVPLYRLHWAATVLVGQPMPLARRTVAEE